ncbi:YhbY family RNA-binding protein [Paraburkholderia sp. CNPSo 3272]|uniref:YhbY family RNA-binding protein n=1 Tax=Paraburkholderia sp. CNPSo 3272 TaxID=2940931 RepID=UPI0020B66786|nr:YhbY family RNA-binding protein [Paraburkholderia sp. CNPSo 3272]MCP3727791.1 YhbY family RNA-binding protein [Paraburkholderia sp. CNPSo 3272]
MPALTLSAEQRSELRSQAHALKPVVLIGAEGLTDAVLKEIKVHLSAHHLIKVRVFGDEREERLAIYEEICDRLSAAPIQHIGKLLVIYKPEEAKAKDTTARAGARGTVSRPAGDVPSAREAGKRGAAPRTVKVVKASDNPLRKPKAQKVTVKGNERVTQGGNIKRAKKRQTSSKRAHQGSK